MERFIRGSGKVGNICCDISVLGQESLSPGPDSGRVNKDLLPLPPWASGESPSSALRGPTCKASVPGLSNQPRGVCTCTVQPLRPRDAGANPGDKPACPPGAWSISTTKDREAKPLIGPGRQLLPATVVLCPGYMSGGRGGGSTDIQMLGRPSGVLKSGVLLKQ